MLAYERASDDERILVVANLGDDDIVHPVHRAEPAAVSDPAVEVTVSSISVAAPQRRRAAPQLITAATRSQDGPAIRLSQPGKAIQIG